MTRNLIMIARWTGLDRASASFESVSTALQNAHLSLDLDIAADKDGITCCGMRIAALEMSKGKSVTIITFSLKPTASMILFANWIMTLLPSTATIRWQGGWPFITCPPSDDRDCDDDPTPLVPNMLELA